jgi:Tfp pilus assembly protein PilF
MSSFPWSALRLAAILLALACTACTTSQPKEAETPPASRDVKETKEMARDGGATPAPLGKAQQELASGIARYEDGNYKLAARQLQSALTQGLEVPEEKARAHKYLAFMHCVGGREKQCREEFRKAIVADPAFDLTPAEAGHPTWGPVFRKLKAAGKPAKK